MSLAAKIGDSKFGHIVSKPPCNIHFLSQNLEEKLHFLLECKKLISKNYYF